MTLETPETKAFIKRLSALDRSKSDREKFRDFCEMSYCAMAKLTAASERAEALEARYMQIVETYQDKDTVRAYPDLLAQVVNAVGKGQDFLGSVSSQLNVLNQQQGQFFTPYPVSLLMASMTLNDIDARIEAKGYITLLEPACGAGGMILAAADVMQQQGYDPTQHLLVHAVDISPLCYHMAYVQLTVKGVPAYVEQGNSLTQEGFDGAWTLPATLFHQQHGVVFPIAESSSDPTPTPEPVMTTSSQPPLQADMFTGEQVDRRTRTQKQQDATRDAPAQQEMFRQRELAQFGVKVKKMDAPAAPLVLIAEDPRTPEEIERDQRRESEALTTPMFQDETPAIPETAPPAPTPPMSVNPLMPDMPAWVTSVTAKPAACPIVDPKQKPTAYLNVIQTAQEAMTTTWVDRLYASRLEAQYPLALLEAKHCGLTQSEITAATQIGEALGNQAVQEAENTPMTLYDRFQQAPMPHHKSPMLASFWTVSK